MEPVERPMLGELPKNIIFSRTEPDGMTPEDRSFLELDCLPRLDDQVGSSEISTPSTIGGTPLNPGSSWTPSHFSDHRLDLGMNSSKCPGNPITSTTIERPMLGKLPEEIIFSRCEPDGRTPEDRSFLGLESLPRLDHRVGSSEFSTPSTIGGTPLNPGSPWAPSPLPDHINGLQELETNILKFPGDPVEYAFGNEDLCDSKRIGAGTFGIVFSRTHRQTGRKMAVKQIYFNAADPRQQRRLLREHKIMHQGSTCQNIVTAYGALLHEGSCLICMELMDTSLDLLYQRVYRTLNQRLDEEMLGVIAVAVINALEYLKTHLNVAHRDVKPPNVLVNRDGQVKMCDFGIVGELENSIIATAVAGCQPYLAPECIRGCAQYDSRSDVWSFGLLMYEVSTGAHAFEGLQGISLLDKIMSAETPQLGLGEPYNFSPDYAKFINRCLRANYHKRRRFIEIKQKEPFYITHSQKDASDARHRLGMYALDSMNSHAREE